MRTSSGRADEIEMNQGSAPGSGIVADQPPIDQPLERPILVR
jgi:hypothetical protein